MEPKMDSGSSVPAMFAAYSRHHKRKKFLNKEDNYSSTASSANAHGPLAMKLQKTSEASAICNFQHGLDRSEFGSVAEEIKVLHARKLPLQRLCSQLNPIPFMHLDAEKKRLVNQKTTRVSRCDVIDLEDDGPRGHVIADIPVIILDSDEQDMIILDSDEEDSGYQKYSHLYCKYAHSGPAHKLSTKDLAACQEVKAPINEARSPPANNDVQLDKSGYTDSENDMQVKDSAKVKASRDVVGGLPNECNIQVDKSPYSGMKSGDQVGDSEHVKNSMDVIVDLPGKCNIQVDLSLYAGKENIMVMKEAKESAYACMESHMVTKEDSHQVDAEDDGLSKIDTVVIVNNFEDDRALGDVTEAGIPVIIIDSDEEDSGPAHGLSMKGLTVKDCQGVEDLKDEARSSPAKYCVQVDKTGYADTMSYIQVEDSADVKDSRGVVGGSLAECNVQLDESPHSGVESDVQIRGSEKSKDSWNVIEDLCGNFSILSLYAGMENYGVLKEENDRIGTEGDASVDNETECATHIRDGEKVNASRDAVEGLPAECDIAMDESAHADMENHMEIKEDNHQINVEDDGLAKFDTEEDILDEDSKKVDASRDAIEGSLDKRNIQVEETAYNGMEDYGVLKEESNQIGAEVDAFVDNETERATQIRDGQKLNASRDAVEGLPTECNFPVDERAHAGMENHMVIKEDNHQINVEYDGLAKIDTEDNIQDRDRKKVEASRDAIEGSLDKCNIQVDERAYAGMENFMALKEDTRKIGVQDDALSKLDSEDDIQDTEGKQVKVLRVMVEDLPSKCSIKVDENPNTDMENIIAIEEFDHQIDVEDDGLADIWKEMAFALEYSKESAADPAIYECVKEDEEECDHSFVLKDDLGYVCRVCGVIQRSIDTVFEFQYPKKRNMRTYAYEPKNTNGKELIDAIPVGINSPDLMVTEIAAHPRHRKEMKPHQIQGFNFLCRNLVADNPGGCILAHAPGSGKTFMIISFLQSFLAKYPDARPLVVLPKGILATWKKEFEIWQVDNIPLHDFYTSKAENRSQQLDVLRRWVKERSILFLGYKQLSVIVCDSRKVGAECQDILLKIPTILILDEGHTPRNEETDVLQSLSKIQTPRKVVLSGTLYQNHVKEVFNILNLVRPQFLKLKASRMIVNRIMSRGQISRVRKHLKHGANSAFFDLVEYTLQKDDDFKRKKAVIQDLRQMTSKVLHYYKGDFLDELPGLVDFTVVLNLSARQKEEVQNLRKLDKFKRISLGSAVYMHPQLKKFSQICFATGEKGSNIDDKKIDAMLENLDVREGVKTKFFLNILRLCESAGEKLLVFSQYILPLKLLERVSAKVKGWSLGKELFMITGDSNTEQRELCMEHFNGSPGAKVFFGSIKACGEGISLVGASRIVILDVHLNPSVTRQAIGRAFRPGQKKKVYTYRLVAADSPEQEDYLTCSKKELISKMWFEWNEYCGDQDFDVKTIDVNECGDMFFESPGLREDVNVLYKR